MPDNDHVLPEIDIEFLLGKGFQFEERQASGEVYLIIHDYPLPPSYTPQRCDLLLKLPAGYPNTNPDMFWTSPAVKLTTGAAPIAAQVMEVHNGRTWQRWSRHTTSWRAGVDSLRTKLRAVQIELEKGR